MNDFYDDDAPFWGEDSHPTAQIRRIGKDVTGQMRRVVHDHNDRHHFDRTREHRVVKAGASRGAAPVTVQAFDYDLDDEYGSLGQADHADDGKWADVDVWVDMDERDDHRRAAGWVGVDRRLLRIGALAAAAVVLVPITIAMASGNEPSNGDVATQTPAAVAQPQSEPTATVPPTIPVTAAIVPVTAAAIDNSSDDDLADGATSAGGVVDKGATEAASFAAAAPVCAGEYTVVAGDYWLRLADGTGASTDEWLAANGASLETALYPGDELCIPEGATAPAPPTTTAPPTTAAPETTAAPTTAAPETTTAPVVAAAPEITAAPTTAAPTTAPPTTAAPQVSLPAPVAAPSGNRPADLPSDVEGIIRYVFPDSEEDYAITIADRESNLDPRVNNWCCYGLFQIYYEVHKGWLDDLGINSAEDLRDPYLNTLAAYTLWQRAGWSPWSTHYA